MTKEAQVEHIGIDFGTTNIAVSGLLVDNISKKAFRKTYGEDSLPYPAIIAFSEEKTPKFGRRVKTQVAAFEEDGFTIIKSIKSAIGKEELFFGKYTATQIVGALAKAIKKKIFNSYNVDITSATLAVPVDFSSKQRKELQKAFNNAGIKINKIVSESMAAYIRNRKEVENFSNVLVFDWGGGTLDLSLLKVVKGVVYEEATYGWKKAGDAIDNLIAQYVHNQLLNNHHYNINCSFDNLPERDKIKLLAECESAKMVFSNEEDIDEPQMIVMNDYCGEKKVRFDLEYSAFENIVRGIISEAVGCIQAVLNKANKTIRDLNAIIMVGGSSNLLPLRNYISDQLEKKHGIHIAYPNKAQWSVAEGAAVIDATDCSYKLNQAINILMSDGTVFPLVQQGSVIPFEETKVSFGTVDNSPSANFVFTDENKNMLGRLAMPVKGFLGETFTVSGKIDNDLIAHIKITGNMTQTEKPLEIRQLSYSCDISEMEKYEWEIQ